MDFAAGGYSLLYFCFITAITDDPTIGLFVYGVFEFEQGLGSIRAGPVSSALVSKDINAQASGIGKYDRLIVFVGATLLASSVGGLGYHFEDTCFRFVCIYKIYLQPRFFGLSD
jgi:hypothetical protein